MWRYLLVGMLLLPLTGRAEVSILDHSAFWNFFAGTTPAGDQVCGVATTFNDGRGIFVKWFGGGNQLAIQIARPGWKVPEKVGIPLTINFDNNKTWSVKGVASTGLAEMLEWYVPHDMVPEFTHIFTAAHFMVINFDSGSEKPWVIDLSGNSAMVDKFAKCVLYVGANDASNPYAYTKPPAPSPTQPTQPYVPATPQPFVPPASTRRPVVPTLPPPVKLAPT